MLVALVQQLAGIAAQCTHAKDALAQGLRPVQDLATWIVRSERPGAPRYYDALEWIFTPPDYVRHFSAPRARRGARRHVKRASGS